MEDRTREQIESRLREIRKEEKALMAELAAVEARSTEPLFANPLGIKARKMAPKDADEKVALFAELFACRKDVYPKLWINRKTSGKGYSPACTNEWVSGLCEKPRIKCSECSHQACCLEGRFPLVISDRKQHLELIAQVIEQLDTAKELKAFVLIGGMGKKARAKVLDDIRAILKTDSHPYILATGSFVGEGFDLPELDTLVLGMPLSFRGRLVQYAGRLHRPTLGKTEVRIYDYADVSSALTMSMLKKRIAVYRKMEYQVELPIALSMRGDLSGRKKLNLFSMGRNA